VESEIVYGSDLDHARRDGNPQNLTNELDSGFLRNDGFFEGFWVYPSQSSFFRAKNPMKINDLRHATRPVMTLCHTFGVSNN
jgi:hypothetical protein